jgi:GT2 family glycosyltransferase
MTDTTAVKMPPSSAAVLPSATVVVPTRNRGELIPETLRALMRLQHPGLDILVVDQSTDDRTRLAIEKEASCDRRVRLCSTQSVGSSAARNVGAQFATGEIVAYTDDDCIVTDGWLDAILNEFRDPGVAAVYGRLVPYETGKRTGREVGFTPNEARTEYSYPAPPWYVGHGGNMAFRRRMLLEVGGFDPLLGAGGLFGACEDLDIAFRLLRQRRRVVYSPRALSYHKHWKDWSAQKRMERAYGIGAGAEFVKYIRCGDAYGSRLMATWIWELGVRRLWAGLLKWRSLKTMYLGYCQLVYPWIGAARSLRHPIDRKLTLYRHDLGASQ